VKSNIAKGNCKTLT